MSIMISPISAEGSGRLKLSEKTSTTPVKASSRPSHAVALMRSPSRKCAPISTQKGMVLIISTPREAVV
jgi:hypothetical protein